ncbi:unnamed protein product [Polarella glacialis]|uniref:beta-N-acetylhexosaminidase n=1 Tax=Polarella glacialis TaxID=89957 RepID=A0A813KIW7_POLGL|nr:unnamed protein product [Polarella glacialis]
MATLYQLVEVRAPSGQDTRITVPGCPHEITDSPAFPHRGLLLDTSRTYYPVPWIKTLIASLAEFKINILHLHLTDTTSWPLEVEEFPELTERLSYRDNNGEKQIYSRADIRELVEYARLRGMSLLPDVDGPAHDPALATGKPLWLTAGGTANYSTQSFGVEPPPGVWNLSNDSALQVVKSVLTQLQEDFSTSPFLHLGGDEPVAGAVCDTPADETQKELCLRQCTTLNGRTGSPWREGCAVVPLRPADSSANVTWWFPEVLNALVQKYFSTVAPTPATMPTAAWSGIRTDMGVSLPPTSLASKSVLQLWEFAGPGSKRPTLTEADCKTCDLIQSSATRPHLIPDGTEDVGWLYLECGESNNWISMSKLLVFLRVLGFHLCPQCHGASWTRHQD